MEFRKISFDASIVAPEQVSQTSDATFVSQNTRTVRSSKIGALFMNLVTGILRPLKSMKKTASESHTHDERRFRSPENKSKAIGMIKPVLIVVVFVILAIAAVRVLGRSRSQNTSPTVASVSNSDQNVTVDREFIFPVVDQKGKEITELKYKVTSAEMDDEIIVQGQKATAVKGRTFLLINIQITNAFEKPITLNSKDYIRLSVNGDKSNWLAPEIHNDPVEIQAISTKITRVGFPINDSDKNLVLQVGEIEGEKQEIEIFK